MSIGREERLFLVEQSTVTGSMANGKVEFGGERREEKKKVGFRCAIS